MDELVYNEADFVEYAFSNMNVEVLHRDKNIFKLPNDLSVEVEKKDLYKLSIEGFVISPFDDIGELIGFIKKNNG